MRVQLNKTILAASLFVSFSSIAFAKEVSLGNGGYQNNLQSAQMEKVIDEEAYYNGIFDMLDKNHDNYLTIDEWSATNQEAKVDLATGGYSRPTFSKKVNAEKNRKVSRGEFLNNHYGSHEKKNVSVNRGLTIDVKSSKLLTGS